MIIYNSRKKGEKDISEGVELEMSSHPITSQSTTNDCEYNS